MKNGILLVLLLASPALSVDYNPPVTQADDTASEMGRQADQREADWAARDQKEWDDRQQASKEEALEERIQQLEDAQKKEDFHGN